MKKQWLIMSTVIAVIGVMAGIGSFLLARFFLGGKIMPLTVGFATVALADVVVFILFYRKIFADGDKKPE